VEALGGIAVVFTIFVSALVALIQMILRFIHPHTLTHLWWLAVAGVIGFVGNEMAAQIRLHAGGTLSGPCLWRTETTHAPMVSSVSVSSQAPVSWHSGASGRSDRRPGHHLVISASPGSRGAPSASEPGEMIDSPEH
jgi:Co/Zn/Cd efflux system component